MASKRRTQPRPTAPIAALLAWLVPGLGHWWIGQRTRAVVFFVVTLVTFWGGIAVGGVRSAVTLRENGAWIAAQLCMGPQAIGALSWSESLRDPKAPGKYKSAWPSSDIGVVYAGVAGLLNLLIILDVLARVDAIEADKASRSPSSERRRR